MFSNHALFSQPYKIEGTQPETVELKDTTSFVITAEKFLEIKTNVIAIADHIKPYVKDNKRNAWNDYYAGIGAAQTVDALKAALRTDPIDSVSQFTLRQRSGSFKSTMNGLIDQLIVTTDSFIKHAQIPEERKPQDETQTTDTFTPYQAFSIVK